ncbi:ABC transporter permease [Thalassotalea sp. M1531]|uniref:ABC transporter permease n=1 Tax=Thalassotalea algicola TaxID=2716224 RepID=A0A7Y0LAT0_9GAMM|nr:ABC transporter permease [Thalassotalea algicola]NMP30687.1 ABC transporter permease [Thalassotalea algicola]
MNALFDLKYAYRMLIKNPGFTALTVSVMAAGLGLCVFMLAFIASVMTRPLPFDNGQDMYIVEAMEDGVQYNGGSLLLHDYEAIKAQSDSFTQIGAYYTATANLSNGDRAQRFAATVTTANIFSYTSTEPLLGRTFTANDAIEGSTPVAVIAYSTWQNYFGGDANIIGQSVKNNGVSTQIIGVMPQGYRFPNMADLWVPLQDDATRLNRSESISVSAFVMKKPTRSTAQVSEELKAIMAEISQKYPETNGKTSAYIATFQKAMMGDGANMIVGLMLTAVSFVLILACVNVGNLLLARANERAKETAIRVALGAPQSRLIMQMMWESIIICVLGGLFGLLLAAWALELLSYVLPNMLPIALPFWWIMKLDSELILQSIAIIGATAFVTGIVPAWKMTRGDFNAILRDGTRGAQGKRAGRINRLLVIVEVALSCILLSLSGVLVVLLQETNNSSYGVDKNNKLTARIGLSEANYPEPHQQEQYYQRLMDKLRSTPGIKGAGAMTSLPGNGAWYQPFLPEGYEVVDNQYPNTGRVTVFEGTMDTIGMELLEGRNFDSRDQLDSLPVAIISDQLARKYWPNESPIGKRFRYTNDESNPWLTIVGVVKHVIHGQPYSNMKHRTAAYVPFTQSHRRFMSIVIDVNGDADDFREALSDAVASLDPEVPAYNVAPLDLRFKRNTGGMTFIRDLFAVFALCALLLASSGIYGVLANSTSKRTQEIGIRRAIGATDEEVMSMLMKQGWKQLAIGLIIGLPLGFLASQGMVQLVGPEHNYYYGVFVAIPLIIAIVVSIATYMPAKKAIALEPSSALRYE